MHLPSPAAVPDPQQPPSWGPCLPPPNITESQEPSLERWTVWGYSKWSYYTEEDLFVPSALPFETGLGRMIFLYLVRSETLKSALLPQEGTTWKLLSGARGKWRWEKEGKA